MTKLGDAVLELRTEDARYKKEVRGAKRLAGGLEAQFKKAAIALIGIGAAAIALRKVSQAIRASIKLFAIQQEAEVGLRAALEQTGKVGEAAFQLIAKSASDLQKITTKADEALLDATSTLALLAPALDAEQLVEAQKAIIGIADVFLKGDVQNAAALIGKTLGSSTNALTRYGLTLDATASTQEKFTKTIEFATSFFAVSQAKAETLTGKLQQLSNAWGDLGEALGAFIGERPLVTAFIDELKGLIESLTAILRGTAPDIERLFNELGIIAGVGFTTSFLEVNKRLGQILLPKFLEGLLLDTQSLIDKQIEAAKGAFAELEAIAADVQERVKGAGGGVLGPAPIEIPEAPALAKQLTAGAAPALAEEIIDPFDELGEVVRTLNERLDRSIRNIGEMATLTVATVPPARELVTEADRLAFAFERQSAFAEELANNLVGVGNTISNQLVAGFVEVLTQMRSLVDVAKQLGLMIFRQVVGALIRAAIQAAILRAVLAGVTGGLGGFIPLARGGMIPAQRGLSIPSTAPQSGVPILAHPGEAVLNRAAVRGIGGPAAVAGLNAGEVGGMQLTINAGDIPAGEDFGIIASRRAIQRIVMKTLENITDQGFNGRS